MGEVGSDEEEKEKEESKIYLLKKIMEKKINDRIKEMQKNE